MKKIFVLLTALMIIGCTKKLDLKPDSSFVIPANVADFTALLDNYSIINYTPGFSQISADEYFIPSLTVWQGLLTPAQRNLSIWKSDVYEGQTQITAWTRPYNAIFICNSVLDIIAGRDISGNSELKNIKGWALFARAYSFYSLVSIFSKGYDASSATTDLGVPLKLSAAIENVVPRSTVQQTYDQITNDLMEAAELLNVNIQDEKRNRPSKIAAYGMLARVFLSMRKYDQAEIYVDKTLGLYSTLIDYNILNTSAISAFSNNSSETIYLTQQSDGVFGRPTSYGVDPNVLNLYSSGDLRFPIYFTLYTNGNYGNKAINTLQAYPFTGLATDEMYLIKAECLARRSLTDESLLILNKFVKTRFKTGSFVPIVAVNADEALGKILLERRKALVWRGLRWTDLKRLNLEGKNITLTRNLSGTVYMLGPNSTKYVLPIPDDEIAISGIQQNIR